MLKFDVYKAYTGKYIYLSHGYELKSKRARKDLVKMPYIINVVKS